jgi:riboflavin transporter FmnP
MFDVLFKTILRSIAIPLVVILVLKSSALGEKNAVLAVSLTLTIVTVFSLIWNLLKVIPNTLLFRGMTIIKIFVAMSIEVVSVIGFWVYYTSLV